MNKLPFSRERQNTFYYSNYLYLYQVQDELVNNKKIKVDKDI